MVERVSSDEVRSIHADALLQVAREKRCCVWLHKTVVCNGVCRIVVVSDGESVVQMCSRYEEKLDSLLNG